MVFRQCTAVPDREGERGRESLCDGNHAAFFRLNMKPIHLGNGRVDVPCPTFMHTPCSMLHAPCPSHDNFSYRTSLIPGNSLLCCKKAARKLQKSCKKTILILCTRPMVMLASVMGGDHGSKPKLSMSFPLDRIQGVGASKVRCFFCYTRVQVLLILKFEV